jgi:hypothetical protein
MLKQKMDRGNLKKTFLYALIASVCLSVVIGILVVLFGTQEQGSRIFLTSLTITVASFSLFLNGIFFERLLGKILPFAGFIITPVCAALCIAHVWEMSNTPRPLATASVLLTANFALYPLAFYHEKKGALIIPLLGFLSTLAVTAFVLSMIWDRETSNETVTRLFYTVYLLALACFYLSFILRVNLSPAFRWSQAATQIVVWLLFSCSAIFVWISKPLAETLVEVMLTRSIIILSILVTAFTVLTPVFYFLGSFAVKIGGLKTIAETDREIEELKFRIAELEEFKTRLENSTSSIS